ncbi:MAG: hypothetical protein FWF81_11985 [Defluviitaleaceae bacterium]|nr:hypothetical protein [Defluviitaleaceae bacterium]
MRQSKILSIFAMLMGLIFISSISVSAATYSGQQRIYSVMEIDSPSPYHNTIVVRTGLASGNVWLQLPSGDSIQGILVSYGESQRVWQVSYLHSQVCPRMVIVNANHSYVADENLVSQLLQDGHIDFSDNRVISISEPPEIVETTEAPAWRRINIIGDDAFVRHTIRAMEAVERGPAWAYDYVVTYLDYVRQHSRPRRAGTGGHINVRTRTFYVYSNTYSGNFMWYASSLVHEAIHARQFREYLDSYGNRPPRRITFYSTFDEQFRLEMEALEYQTRFLEEANAARHLINHARSRRGTVWWR